VGSTTQPECRHSDGRLAILFLLLVLGCLLFSHTLLAGVNVIRLGQLNLTVSSAFLIQEPGGEWGFCIAFFTQNARSHQGRESTVSSFICIISTCVSCGNERNAPSLCSHRTQQNSANSRADTQSCRHCQECLYRGKVVLGSVPPCPLSRATTIGMLILLRR